MQIYDEKGEMQYFAVINCDNYVKEVRERQVTLGPVNRR